jgi:translocation and assembly module TamA
VTLADRKRHALELGAGYSTTEGSGLDAKWTLYNRLGLGDSLILTAKLYDIQQKLDLEQDLPDWARPDQTLKIGGGFLGERTSAYDDLGGGVRVDVVRRFDKTNAITLGVSLDYASTREKTAINLLATPVGENLNLAIATLKTGFTLDRSNSILNPTRGWRLDAEADPTFITGDRTLGYLKTQGQLSGYAPLGGGWPVLAARLKLGSIWGGSIPDVPADRRFFAGGGGSVRGYGYQEVGPRLSDNTPEGGLSLTEASIELRQALTRRWGLVAFADAGEIGSTDMPAFDALAYGVGLGVRYDLGFGPLRLDLATPLNPRAGDSRVQVYISIGQAF